MRCENFQETGHSSHSTKWTESNVTVFYSKTFKPWGMDTCSKPPKRSQSDGKFERTNQISLGSQINMEADQLPMSWFEMLNDISRGLTLFLQRQKPTEY